MVGGWAGVGTERGCRILRVVIWSTTGETNLRSIRWWHQLGFGALFALLLFAHQWLMKHRVTHDDATIYTSLTSMSLVTHRGASTGVFAVTNGIKNGPGFLCCFFPSLSRHGTGRGCQARGEAELAGLTAVVAVAAPIVFILEP